MFIRSSVWSLLAAWKRNGENHCMHTFPTIESPQICTTVPFDILQWHYLMCFLILPSFQHFQLWLEGKLHCKLFTGVLGHASQAGEPPSPPVGWKEVWHTDYARRIAGSLQPTDAGQHQAPLTLSELLRQLLQPLDQPLSETPWYRALNCMGLWQSGPEGTH